MSHLLHGIGAALGVTTAPAWLFRPPSGGKDRTGLMQASNAAARELEALSRRLRDAGRPEESHILAEARSIVTDALGRTAGAGRG